MLRSGFLQNDGYGMAKLIIKTKINKKNTIKIKKFNSNPDTHETVT